MAVTTTPKIFRFISDLVEGFGGLVHRVFTTRGLLKSRKAAGITQGVNDRDIAEDIPDW
jgi:hypothetical protein